MALLTHDYYCPKLGMASELRITAPDPILLGEEKPKAVLFLLSAQGEGGLSLLTGTKIAALCEEYRIAAVLPPCLQGCYTDMVFGYPFYQSLRYVREYLSVYLPGLAPEAGKCAVAGIGIGGLAALRWACEEPEYFTCAASVGGILDPAVKPGGYFTERRLSDLFGTQEERLEKRGAFQSLLKNGAQKKIYLFSSKEDPGYESTVSASEILGNRAQTCFADGISDMKTYSDQLGIFVKQYLGGEA